MLDEQFARRMEGFVFSWVIHSIFVIFAAQLIPRADGIQQGTYSAMGHLRMAPCTLESTVSGCSGPNSQYVRLLT
jgi:hypothetical protein